MDRTSGSLRLLTQKGRQYLAFIPNHADGSALSSLGFRVDKVEGLQHPAWIKIFHPSVARQVLRFFPDVDIDPQISAYVHLHLEENKRPYEDSYVAGDKRLKPWQPEAIRFIASRKKAFLALAPGLGKTLCALKASQVAGYKCILVVAPLSLLDNWHKEIAKWLPRTAVAIFRASGKQIHRVPHPERLVIVTSYEGMLRYHKEIASKAKIDLLIFDESILLKNRDTMRFVGRPERKSEKTGKILPAVDGISKLLSHYRGSIWMLSGGPTSKYLSDLWAQLYLIDRKRFSSFWSFTNTYCFVEKSEWGDKIIDNKPGAFETLKDDLSDIFYSRSQDEVGANLPEFLSDDIEVEMDTDQVAAYSQMETEFFAVLPDDETIVSTNLLTQLLRLNQIASNPELMSKNGVKHGSPLWDAAVAALEYEPLPAIIWTNFIETATYLKEVLRKAKYRVAVLNGTVPRGKRQGVVDALQDGKIDVLLAHPAVGKYGFTLTKARTAIYLERSFNGDDFYQSMYRIRRIGTEERPRVLYMLSTCDGARTVHHAIHEVLKYKHDNNLHTITARSLRAAWRGEER